MNILLCTLGASWAVIPEVFGFVAPEVLDLYAHHPQRSTLDELRRASALAAPNELWICTTEGEKTLSSLKNLREWWQGIGAPMPLRVWRAAGTNELATQEECTHIRELTLRVALLASERCQDGQLMLSLAGGRKTMSADLQWAGTLFGAAALFHVVGPERLDDAIGRNATPALFTAPLSAKLARAIMPLIVGSSRRDDLLDVELEGQRINAERFPLPLAAPLTDCNWPPPADGPTLTQDIIRRQQEGSRLFGNFIAHLAQSESHENWRSLYRLPPARIAALRETPLGPDDRDWLTRLPKADLHRHLGGCLSLEAQRSVGQAVWNSLDAAAQGDAMTAVKPLLAIGTDWPWSWPETLRGPNRAGRVAALLVHASETVLERNLYGVTRPRVALRTCHEHGFAAYERPGELTGSAILTHPAALEPYAQALVEQARAENLAYVELRGSPHKYRDEDPGGFVRDLAAALSRAGANQSGQEHSPLIRFIWILDRRDPERLRTVIKQAVATHASPNGFLVGLDLAGDEQNPLGEPEALAPGFLPAFKECLPLTIHAGEGESAANIWQAAYHLHADRIGHGLTLADNAALATRFHNRGIGLELCPTSNREVVGFHDPGVPETRSLPTYPLRRFIELGLPVTLCTDNPGISRTTLTDEYLTASRMTEGKLSRWEALALIKQGFSLAFLPASERETLIKRMDQVIYQQVNQA